MLPGERLSFVCGKKLCFCCFDSRHAVRQCRAGVICSVEGCTTKHSKLLHQSFEQTGKKSLVNSKQCLILELVVNKLKTTPMHAAHQNKGRSS